MNENVLKTQIKTHPNGPSIDSSHFIFNIYVLFGVLFTFVNDFFLKSQFSNPLTGKISDFSGLFFFPFFFISICGLPFLLTNKPIPRKMWNRLFWTCLILIDCVFVGLQLCPPIVTFYEESLGAIGVPSRVTRYPWDIMALVMNIPSYFLFRKIINKN